MPRRGYPLEGPRAGGMTRLAADAGISQATMSRLLSGRGEPSYDSLRKIGALWGYTLHQMMVFAGITEPDEQGARADQPASEPASTGVRVEQRNGGHVTYEVTVESELTMDEAIASLGVLADYEELLVHNLRLMKFEPAQVAGAVLLLRSEVGERVMPDAGRAKRRA